MGVCSICGLYSMKFFPKFFLDSKQLIKLWSSKLVRYIHVQATACKLMKSSLDRKQLINLRITGCTANRRKRKLVMISKQHIDLWITSWSPNSWKNNEILFGQQTAHIKCMKNVVAVKNRRKTQINKISWCSMRVYLGFVPQYQTIQARTANN